MPVTILDAPTQRALVPVLNQALGTTQTQVAPGPNGQLIATTADGLQAAFFVLGVSRLSGLARAQAAPGLTQDPLSGVARS